MSLVQLFSFYIAAGLLLDMLLYWSDTPQYWWQHFIVVLGWPVVLFAWVKTACEDYFG